MPQDSSLVGSFDLKSQAGVMSVLAAIRASKLSPADKNELRDLIFTYTNGGGDASVRISIEQKLNTHQILPVVVQRSGKPAPVLSFGTYRPTPNFKAPVATSPTVSDNSAVQSAINAPVFGQSSPASVQPQPSVVPSAPLAQSQASVSPSPVVPVEMPTVAPVAPVRAEMPVPTVTATPASVPATTPVPVPTPTPVIVPVPAPSPTPIQPQAVASGPEVNYLERIRQIKTAVNSKVGNPVNLVDINNEVGREYMNALLEAMKKLGSGAVSEMGPAMGRLESAYIAVEAAISVHQAKNQTPATPTLVPTPNPAPTFSEPVPTPPPAPPLAPPTTAFTPPVPDYTPPASPVTSVPIPTQPIRDEITIQSQTIAEQEATNIVLPQPVVDITFTPSPVPSSVPVPRPDIPPPSAPVPVYSENSTPFSDFETNPSPVTVTPSLADAKRILTPNDLPDPASVSTGEGGDSLFTKEIDDGLQQLLVDWSLFKKSGLFGTGPRGREHPLYKKICDLQLPFLLAGRFEGSSQEIRQSVTDYMNGWRYEQGIVYQPGETFERYLRRVIKHILDLQKKRHQA